MAAYDDEENDEPEGEEMHFDCPCGRSLNVPLAMTGSLLECPWCMKWVRVPKGADDKARIVEMAPKKSDEDLVRCPSCAALCEQEKCPSCDIAPVSAKDWEVLPYAADQDVVSPDAADWILRRTRWLMSRQTREEFFARPLLLPTDEFFPRRWTSDLPALEDLTERMRLYAGLAEHPVKVEVKDEVTSLSRKGVSLGSWFAGGCIWAPQWRDGIALIQVELLALEHRFDMVSTLAHELGHLFGFVRLGCAKSPPSDNEELTDLIAAMHGAGVFVCRSAQDYHRGWKGYLSQAELSFALALFCAIRGIRGETVAPHLSVDPRAFFDTVLRFLESTPAAVREVASVLR